MTDLTILIAVIALALWPLAFLVLRIRHERKKRRDRLDRMTKEDLEDIGTEELVIAVLKKIGCQPETNEEGHIVFKYQGDDFYIAVEDEARFIMIWNPWWASISVDNPALPYLKEIVNLVNVDSLVTTVFTADEDEKNVGLHSKCHTVFTPKEGQLDEYLKAMLDHFFVTHDAIKQNFCRRREKIRNVFIRSGFYESCFDVWFKATLFVFILMLNPFSLRYFFSYL